LGSFEYIWLSVAVSLSLRVYLTALSSFFSGSFLIWMVHLPARRISFRNVSPPRKCLNFFSPLLISIDIHAVGSFFLPEWREKKNRTDREVELRNSCQMNIFFCFFGYIIFGQSPGISKRIIKIIIILR
jgi:hypothetical protein